MRNNVRFEIGSRGGGPSRRDEDKRGATGGETRARSISHMSQAVHTRYTHIRERCVAPSGSGHNRKTTKPRLTTPVNRTRADTRSRKTAVRNALASQASWGNNAWRRLRTHPNRAVGCYIGGIWQEQAATVDSRVVYMRMGGNSGNSAFLRQSEFSRDR